MKVMRTPGIRSLTVIEDDYPSTRRIYVSDSELGQLIQDLRKIFTIDHPDNLPISGYEDEEEV